MSVVKLPAAPVIGQALISKVIADSSETVRVSNAFGLVELSIGLFSLSLAPNQWLAVIPAIEQECARARRDNRGQVTA